ncbi:MAG: peptide ABC transporter substrate-binding protein [Nodosilinea sp.]
MKLSRAQIALGLAATGLALFGATTLHRLASSAPTPSTSSFEGSDSAPQVSRDANTLRLLYSRSAVTLNPHLATGYQDFEAARLVYEPLASYNEAGELVPFLAATIPTQDNGGVSPDGRSVTWKLRQEVTWSDGQPFTAADVVFTFEFIRNPAIATATAQYYETIKSVEALDDLTVQITFIEPNPAWSVPFTGQTGMILPRHVFEQHNHRQARQATANLQPVGTGPYQVMGFKPGAIIFSANPTYWDGSPAFKQVEWLGGLAPYAAAREVLQVGTADVAPNLQVEAAALNGLASNQAQGHIVNLFGAQVERIMINFAHPFARTEEGERSSPKIPHPYFKDWRVRQAINLAVDRQAIVEELYGDTGQPTAQLVVDPSAYQAPKLTYEYNLEKAKTLLDQSGWIDRDGDGIRDQEGVAMKILFQSAVNPVRQRTQAIVVDRLEELGIAVEISRVRVDEFFSANPKDSNTLNHFYADLQIYSTGNEGPDPITYMGWWTCDRIASQANQWQEPNNARYCNPDYDKLWAQARVELNPEKRQALFQQMNQLLTKDVAVIPVVHRAMVNAVSDRLTGVEFTPWDASTWKIKDWALIDGSKQEPR